MPCSRHKPSLVRRFPPSAPCTCAVCVGYCARPGWWTVVEAHRAMAAGLGHRMMLEPAPDRSFGVLAPAFRGCEGGFALQEFARCGCTFLNAARCELFASGLSPLECRFCHHDRAGQGPLCHAALEQDWMKPAGRALVHAWCRQMGLWEVLEMVGLKGVKR